MSGGIIKRMHPDVPFVQVPNTTAQDFRLTLAALGLLTYLGSLPEDWTVRDQHVQAHFGIGKDALRSVYGCLIKAGYAKRRHRVRQPDGRFTTVTTIALEPVFAREGVLTVPESRHDARKTLDLVARLAEMQRAWRGGATITVNGRPVDIDPWPHVRLSKGRCSTVGSLIKGGAMVEIRHQSEAHAV